MDPPPKKSTSLFNELFIHKKRMKSEKITEKTERESFHGLLCVHGPIEMEIKRRAHHPLVKHPLSTPTSTSCIFVISPVTCTPLC